MDNDGKLSANIEDLEAKLMDLLMGYDYAVKFDVLKRVFATYRMDLKVIDAYGHMDDLKALDDADSGQRLQEYQEQLRKSDEERLRLEEDAQGAMP